MREIIISNVIYYGNFFLFYFLLARLIKNKIFPILKEKYEHFIENRKKIINEIALQRHVFSEFEVVSCHEKKNLVQLKEKIKLFVLWKQQQQNAIEELFSQKQISILKEKEKNLILIKKNLVLNEIQATLSKKSEEKFNTYNDFDFWAYFFVEKGKEQ